MRWPGSPPAARPSVIAARLALAELPLRRVLDEPLIPYEADEVTRLIIDGHDAAAFAGIADLSVGEFRDWLLDRATDTTALTRVARGVTPEDGGGGEQADA